MNNEAKSMLSDVMKAVHYRPAVSIILPYDVKMNLQTEMEYALKSAISHAEKELLEKYPAELSVPVINKLKMMSHDLLFDTGKKGIALYASPVFHKMLYLQTYVTPKVIVDESFEIRDLVYNEQQQQEFLLLTLSSSTASLYRGNTQHLYKIPAALPASADDFRNDIAEKVTNFSDMAYRKEVLLEKYLLHIDHALDTILLENPLPVIVIGTERTAGHFKHITRHAGSIISYLQGNFEEATTEILRNKIKMPVADWQQQQQELLLRMVTEAEGNRKLASGIQDVWESAMQNKGRLLVVETNYSYAAGLGDHNRLLKASEAQEKNVTIIKDVADIIIEKVLESGGQVRFVDQGRLKHFRHIALIQYY